MFSMILSVSGHQDIDKRRWKKFDLLFAIFIGIGRKIYIIFSAMSLDPFIVSLFCRGPICVGSRLEFVASSSQPHSDLKIQNHSVILCDNT